MLWYLGIAVQATHHTLYVGIWDNLTISHGRDDRLDQTLRIATRESALALWQAHHIRDSLQAAHPGLTVNIIGMTTAGDRNKRDPLSRIGGKGVFVKELEQALLDNRADIAVHSMKDVPGELPAGLALSAICSRADPRDALVIGGGRALDDLPAGARVGSSSLRRRFQLRKHYPRFDYRDLRGNVDTRLAKLDSGEFDAIVLAASGLTRLGLSDRISAVLEAPICLPASGQGALGIECRAADEETRGIIDVLDDRDSHDCVKSERAVTIALGATCNLPIAAYAEIEGDQLRLRAFVSDESGEQHLEDEVSGPRAQCMSLAGTLAARLLEAGADRLIGDAAAH